LNALCRDDGSIIDAVLAGDVALFDEIVRRYHGALRRVAFSRIGRHDSAEDVVQETFLCAFKSLPSYDSRYSFRTWLWTILLNQCRRHHQKQIRRRQVGLQVGLLSAADAAGLASTEPSPPAALASRERSELLHELLGRLPEPQADALRLRFFGELKFQEIADAMGCSLSSAKNRVRWGLTEVEFENENEL
jgi:RNA polymerase sigma-70 factor (ECF subfamily)